MRAVLAEGQFTEFNSFRETCLTQKTDSTVLCSGQLRFENTFEGTPLPGPRVWLRTMEKGLAEKIKRARTGPSRL